MKALLVGLGHIGWQGFADYTDLKSNVETHGHTLLDMGMLAAAVDPDATKRREFQASTGLRVYERLEDALAAEQPAIVSICTPPETHMDLTMASYAANVNCVVVEKPMGMDVKECRYMLDAAAGRPLIVGHQRRYESRHRQLRDLIRSGVLGEPVLGTSDYYCPPDGDHLRNGTHAVDTLRFLIGDDVIKSYTARPIHGFGVRVICRRGSVSLSSGGDYAPGYLRAMYEDAIACIKTGKTPECSGEDGLEAVRLILAAANLENAA